MNVRLTIWRKDDNVHSHIMDLNEALWREDKAARSPGFIKAVIQSEAVTVDEALAQGGK